MRPLPLRLAALCVLSLALSACGSLAPRAPSTTPSLDLISSAPLVVADGCEARGSYVVGFTVTPQGRTSNIKPPEAPVCVREALAKWAASFQFSPPPQPTEGSMEWMLVTARRGS